MIYFVLLKSSSIFVLLNRRIKIHAFVLLHLYLRPMVQKEMLPNLYIHVDIHMYLYVSVHVQYISAFLYSLSLRNKISQIYLELRDVRFEQPC